MEWISGFSTTSKEKTKQGKKLCVCVGGGGSGLEDQENTLVPVWSVDKSSCFVHLQTSIGGNQWLHIGQGGDVLQAPVVDWSLSTLPEYWSVFLWPTWPHNHKSDRPQPTNISLCTVSGKPHTHAHSSPVTPPDTTTSPELAADVTLLPTPRCSVDVVVGAYGDGVCVCVCGDFLVCSPPSSPPPGTSSLMWTLLSVLLSVHSVSAFFLSVFVLFIPPCRFSLSSPWPFQLSFDPELNHHAASTQWGHFWSDILLSDTFSVKL